MSEFRKVKWLIAGGCPRSGTTILNFLLDSHPQIFLANEQNLFKTIQISEQFFYREKHIMTRKPRKLSINENNIGSYENETKKATIKKLLSQRAVITELFASSLINKKNHTNVLDNIVYIGDKCANYYLWNLQVVEELLGSIKYIHLTRSPLQNINSNLFRIQMSKEGKDFANWQERTVQDCVNNWITAWNFACRAKEKYDFLHLRYEDLISEPKIAFNSIGEFLDVDQTLFDISKIVSTSKSTDYISAQDMEILQKCIPNELLDWSEPLEYLETKYQHIDINLVQKKTDMTYKLKKILKSKINRISQKLIKFLS